MLMLISSIALAIGAPATAALASAGSDGQKAGSRSPVTRIQRGTVVRLQQWLVGSWDMACSSDADTAWITRTALRPNGRFTLADGYGSWSVSGTRLNIRVERHPSVVVEGFRLAGGGNPRIRITGPDEMLVDWGRGPAIRFVRCS